MKFTFLGTGTSQGVPVIGCDCEVCLSKDAKDSRLRAAGLVSEGEKNVAIDIGPDFRQQVLRVGIRSLDAIVLTHEHNDHVVGLDEVRPFNFMTRKSVQLFGETRVLNEINTRFAYIFQSRRYPGAPDVHMRNITDGQSLELEGWDILPLRIFHGGLPILGFRIGDFAYCTDVKRMPDQTKEVLFDIPQLVLSSLHHKNHHSHMNLEEALALCDELRPGRCYLTHISHKMGLHARIQQSLPEGVILAYDGLVIDL